MDLYIPMVQLPTDIQGHYVIIPPPPQRERRMKLLLECSFRRNLIRKTRLTSSMISLFGEHNFGNMWFLWTCPTMLWLVKLHAIPKSTRHDATWASTWNTGQTLGPSNGEPDTVRLKKASRSIGSVSSILQVFLGFPSLSPSVCTSLSAVHSLSFCFSFISCGCRCREARLGFFASQWALLT